ncbi:molybdopterin-binding/glycosyltransferase family 2 protein [Afifella sp. JA880]|uniref:molybdopterin-binding/glycosyltransferase family 2 protein n=1 Tax=Afifella sp. JA880 TaxID=2975280 RepID=UPI0021BB617C|nr:molybdopterin-binding/glycosyltransferase family 2 protein [Afifella sp. JA880]MCT8267297.1 molybdopterin-binding/glycosyltransferase family 2 protein [Afifella sp. JA880]
MKFGPIAVAEAEGTILAHKIRAGDLSLKKGARLNAEDIARLQAAGISAVIAARLDASDLHEDQAAERIARAIAGGHLRIEAPFTGRCNLHAEVSGVFRVDKDLIDALNRIDPGLTVATLAPFEAVEAGRMIATVKIIPFALSEEVLETAERLLASHEPPLSVAAFRPCRVSLVSTCLPSTQAKMLDKTRRVLEARLEKAGASLTDETRVAHVTQALAEALRKPASEGADIIVVFGASAITDQNDIIPAALRMAGGRVLHFGMPVDPGNLLLIGELGGRPVIGAPGCARSPKENGFDFVLNRFLAGLEVRPEDIMGMGVGGLLSEIVSRPQPRQPSEGDGGVAAIVLAAGRSRRMGGPNKLLARFDDVPLVRRTVETVTASGVSEVVVVTGHMREAVEEVLEGSGARLVHNPDFAEGLASSLRVGLRALPEGVSGALIVLADMPGLTREAIVQMLAAFEPDASRSIVLATASGKHGNPVLWARRYFDELLQVSGDTGGRHVIGLHPDDVFEVEIGAAARLDVDTPEALEAAGGVIDPAREG